MRVALFQPDIPQNVGAVLRLAACLDVPVDVIGPCGFPFSDAGLRRAGMDYAARARVHDHISWAHFQKGRQGRLVLATTAGALPFHDCAFRADDVLLFGRESAGVPDEVHRAAQARIVVPMAPGGRSLNVAMCAAIVLAEALRQTGTWPEPAPVSDPRPRP